MQTVQSKQEGSGQQWLKDARICVRLMYVIIRRY